jgi:site-specific DNA recombinase
MGQFVEAYLAERRALSADARRDKVKIVAKIDACKRSIERLVQAVENGTLEMGEVALRLQIQRSEQARLQRELESADALVVSVDFHPTAIDRFKQNLEKISAAGGRIDPQVAASFRDLVDSVVVMARKPGEPYRLEIRGPTGSVDRRPSGAFTRPSWG